MALPLFKNHIMKPGVYITPWYKRLFRRIGRRLGLIGDWTSYEARGVGIGNARAVQKKEA